MNKQPQPAPAHFVPLLAQARRRYDVATSTVVAVSMRGEEELGFDRLDQVWTLIERPDELQDYVREAIRTRLAGGAS